MQISQLTITYSRTQSLPNYSNIKPSVTLTATLDDEDDPMVAYGVLMHDAKRLVHGEIDDALEVSGQSPIFTDEPLLSLYRNRLRQVMVIVPGSVSVDQLDALNLADPNREHYRYRGHWDLHTHRQRLWTIRRIAGAGLEYPVLDCSDGDLSRIPPFPEPKPVEVEEPKYEPVDYSDRPENERFPDDWDEEE